MLESKTSRYPDGTILRKFANGFVFEGYADAHDEPISGTLITPEGVKYEIPDFNGEYIYNVFELIQKGQMNRYLKR